MERSLDSVFNHDPLYRVEWRDTEDCIVQVSIMNLEAFEDLKFKDMMAIIKEAGETAVSVKWEII